MTLWERVKLSNIVFLKQFIKHYQLKEINILENTEVIEKFLDNYYECQDPKNWDECQQLIKGYQMHLIYENRRIYLEMIDCLHRKHNKDVVSHINKYLICHFPNNMKNLSLKNDFILPNNDQTRLSLQKYFYDILAFKEKKGLYIFGKPGVGKTFLLILLANELVRQNCSIAFVFVPKLINDLKQALSKNASEVNIIIEKLQKAEALFLDDLAGEPVSDWTRDEVLFSILNHRMQNNLLTFFSSNLEVNNLQEYYSRNLRLKSIDMLKSIRLVERIRYLAKPIFLDGIVRRKYA